MAEPLAANVAGLPAKQKGPAQIRRAGPSVRLSMRCLRLLKAHKANPTAADRFPSVTEHGIDHEQDRRHVTA